MASTLSDLQQRFSIPSLVQIDAGQGGLTCLRVTSPLATAEIYLHGAHVTHFQPAGQKPALWMSGKSLYQSDKAIRGGVPICFPWFGPKAGDPTASMHGFARLTEWNIESVTRTENAGVEVILSLSTSDQTRKVWPCEFAATYHVRIGKSLELELIVRNTGNTPFTFEEALHTYFAVGDVRQASVTGLEDSTYIDKADGLKQKSQGDSLITITAETDRVYPSTEATCALNDPAQQRRIRIAKSGSRSTVVWNPWIAKSKAMADFGDDEWPGMICIETCNVGDDRVRLDAGKSHEMKAMIAIE